MQLNSLTGLDCAVTRSVKAADWLTAFPSLEMLALRDWIPAKLGVAFERLTSLRRIRLYGGGSFQDLAEGFRRLALEELAIDPKSRSAAFEGFRFGVALSEQVGLRWLLLAQLLPAEIDEVPWHSLRNLEYLNLSRCTVEDGQPDQILESLPRLEQLHLPDSLSLEILLQLSDRYPGVMINGLLVDSAARR